VISVNGTSYSDHRWCCDMNPFHMKKNFSFKEVFSPMRRHMKDTNVHRTRKIQFFGSRLDNLSISRSNLKKTGSRELFAWHRKLFEPVKDGKSYCSNVRTTKKTGSGELFSWNQKSLRDSDNLSRGVFTYAEAYNESHPFSRSNTRAAKNTEVVKY